MDSPLALFDDHRIYVFKTGFKPHLHWQETLLRQPEQAVDSIGDSSEPGATGSASGDFAVLG